MKKFIKFSVILWLMFILSLECMGAQKISIIINGASLQSSNSLKEKNGKIYVSVRDIGEAYGYEFKWIQETKTANLKGEDLIIALQPNNRWFSTKKKDGSVGTFEFNENDAPILIDNVLYVPITNFTIATQGKIMWDKTRNSYHIIYGDKLNYVKNGNVQFYNVGKEKMPKIQSICINDDEETYIIESGKIKRMTKSHIEDVSAELDNIQFTQIRGNDATYALSLAYKNEKKEQVYSIFKVGKNEVKPIYTQNAKKTKVIDFDIYRNKSICILKEDLSDHKRYLEIIDLKKGMVQSSIQIDNDFNCLAVGDKVVYIGSSKKGSIYSYTIGAEGVKCFVGTDGKHRFLDGDTPLFCAPRKLKYRNGALYILDYNVLRKVAINSSGVTSTTIAGEATTLIDTKMKEGKVESLLLSPTHSIDFDINKTGIILTDAQQGQVVEINKK